MNGNAENEEFARLIDALNPWLGEVVIVGGWAHRLYRILPVAQVIAYVLIGTLDTDVAIPAGLRVSGQFVTRSAPPTEGKRWRLAHPRSEWRWESLSDSRNPSYASIGLFLPTQGRSAEKKCENLQFW